MLTLANEPPLHRVPDREAGGMRGCSMGTTVTPPEGGVCMNQKYNLDKIARNCVCIYRRR